MLGWLRGVWIDKKSHKISSQELIKKPVDVDEMMRSGFALHQAGKLIEASNLYQKILEIEPIHSDSLYLLGLIREQQGNLEAAEGLIKNAIEIDNTEPAFHKSLGSILNDRYLKIEATKSYERAFNLDRTDAEVLLALGSIYEELGQLRKAEEKLVSCLKIAPTFWQALNILGEIYLQLGNIQEAINALRKCHELNPTNPAYFSSYLFSLNFNPDLSADFIFAEHRRFESLYRIHRPEIQINHRHLNKRLRIGYVSPDFRMHPVSRFIVPVLEHHDHIAFEIFCYYSYPKSDEVTQHIKKLADHWVDCSSDEDLINQIQSDEIDILIDLAGHTSHNSLKVFLHKPAPIQVSWLGYINTTGLSTIDYRIVDPYSDPVGNSEKFHSESLLRVANCQWCYRKPDQLIDVSVLPALDSGYICFGSLNRFTKLSTKILKLWAILLTEIPKSKLIIVGAPHEKHADLFDFFDSFGISNDRIAVYKPVGLEEFRVLHHEIDIALDSHPYSGATTTCDSAWMGVPTLTLAGETSISRSTSSILLNLGLNDWIAHTENEFIDLARKQVNNLDNLSNLRANLRKKLESSPIMNASQFTIDLEKAYREIWIKKCSGINSSP
jgi:predicted O-linked N-acetylglucosamine transferase (SPINDLY family)